jgi:hypothetical protein
MNKAGILCRPSGARFILPSTPRFRAGLNSYAPPKKQAELRLATIRRVNFDPAGSFSLRWFPHYTTPRKFCDCIKN